MFKFALIELVDRYCIAKLKMELLGNNKEELDFYSEQMKEFDMELIKDELAQLYELHKKIWSMEDDFKKCTVELKYPMDEIGRRAIIIRDISKERYVWKNKIAEKLNDPIREKKKYFNQIIE